MNKLGFKKRIAGFTIIEALTFLFIFSVITLTFYSVFTLGTNYIIESKVRLAAAALANERMEIIHNLDYADIGTTEGIPSGNIPEKETVARSGRTFYIFTFVQYVDDSYDGTAGGSPNDTVSNDYKRVSVKAAWEDDINSNKSVVLVSNFAPPKKETPEGGGTLSINVLDKNGAGIPQVAVHLTNPGKSVNITTVTDNTGNISFPAAPADGQNYKIELSKSGYYSAQSYPPYPTTSYDPVDEHAAVTEGLLNVWAIITDKISSITLLTEDPFGAAIPDIDFNLKGGRKVGDTVVDLPEVPEPVYDFIGDFNTGSDGESEFQDRSYGLYTFAPDVINYEFIKLNPSSTENDNFELEPGVDLEVKAIFADKSVNSLLVTVMTADTEPSPVESASVQLKNEILGYDATVVTDKFGKAYFPTALPELAADTYELNVSAAGYQDESQSISVDDLILETVSLTAL